MLFIDHSVWSELARLDLQFVVLTATLLTVALALTPSALQPFGGKPRPGFFLTALLVPVYLLMPVA